jgi:hypothetical protein
LETKIHLGQSVYQTVLILKTLLCHVQSLLHCHCEGNTKRENKTSYYQNNINKINLMSGASWRASEGKTFEMGKPTIDES